jgi:hypothetical protein
MLNARIAAAGNPSLITFAGSGGSMGASSDDDFDWGVFDEPRTTRVWSRPTPSVDDGDDHDLGPRPGRRRLLLAGAGALVLLVVLAALLVLRNPGGEPDAGTTAPVEAAAPAMSAEVWDVTGAVLPVSPTEGPARNDVLASGFARSTEGAAIAAAHLSVRTDPRTGPAIYTPTIRDQMQGGTDRVLGAVSARYTELANEAGVTDGGPLPVGTPARITGYRVDGDPSGAGEATVHLQVRDGSGDELDFAVPMVWNDQEADWRLVAPGAGSASLFEVGPASGQYVAFPEPLA